MLPKRRTFVYSTVELNRYAVDYVQSKAYSFTQRFSYKKG